MKPPLKKVRIAGLDLTGTLLAALALLALGLAPGSAEAQLGGPGFTFRQPTVFMAVHGGFAVPRGSSDLFDQTMDEVFLEGGDLQSPGLAGELSIRVTDRLDMSLEVAHAWSRTSTEWREFTEDDGRAIPHTVSFSRTPVTLSARYYMADRGRRIGQFVWIPNRVVPFAAVGAGVMRFRFARGGDFVDPQSLIIYTDNLEHVGSAFTAHAAAGLEVGLTKVIYLVPQARYTWGKGSLDRSVYEGFERLDLSGILLSLGMGVRF